MSESESPNPAPEPEPNPEGNPANENANPNDPPPGDPLVALRLELDSERQRIAHLSATVARQAIVIAQGEQNAAEIAASRKRGDLLKSRMLATKEAAAEAKKSFEAWNEEFVDLTRDLLSGQRRLPFGDEAAPAAPPPPPADANASANGTPAAPQAQPDPVTAAAATALAAPEDDTWRLVPLRTLGIADELPEKLLEKLADASIVTVGDLQAWTAPQPGHIHGRELTEIAGIGPAKADKIAAALDAFWAVWAKRQNAKNTAAAQAAEAEAQVDVLENASLDDAIANDDLADDELDVEFDDESSED